MGLRMFCEPEALEPPKLTIKTDPSALARSAIRRHRTGRDGAHVRDRVQPTNGHSRETDRRSVDNRRRGISALNLIGLRNSVNAGIEAGEVYSRRSALAGMAYVEASQRRQLQTERTLLRDALSYEHTGRRMSDQENISESIVSTRPAVPEIRRNPDVGSNWRHTNAEEIMPSHRSDEMQWSGPEHMLTPHYSLGDSSNVSTTYQRTAPVATTSLTPRFAPAYRFDLTEERSFREFLLRQGFGVPRGVSRHELPPLRRVERRSASGPSRINRQAATDAVDGLGDRRRSLSPEDDFWGTLLTTMMPDDRLPSIHPSFTSMRASASSLSSNSASSHGTLLTAPSSSNALDDAYPSVCDSSDSEGSETEDDPRNGLQGSTAEAYSLQESITHSYLNPQQSMTSLSADQRARHSRLMEREEELLQIQNSLDRLERQVPQEWWAASGMDRNDLNREQ